MIRTFLFAMFSVLVSTISFTQSHRFSTSTVQFQNRDVQAIEVRISPDPADLDVHLSQWLNEYVDFNGKSEKILFKENNLVSALAIVIPEISPRRMDLYSRIVKSGPNETTLYFFGTLGGDEWLDMQRRPQEFLALNSVVMEFVVSYLEQFYSDKIEETKSNLSSLTTERKSLQTELSIYAEELEVLMQEHKLILDLMNTNEAAIKEHEEILAKKKALLDTLNR